MGNIKEDIHNKFLWLTVDETTDLRSLIINVNRRGMLIFLLQPNVQAKSLTFNENKCRKTTGPGNVLSINEDS
ncbi:hypothetical protein NQ318_004487, partial [Aromia moschata]